MMPLYGTAIHVLLLNNNLSEMLCGFHKLSFLFYSVTFDTKTTLNIWNLSIWSLACWSMIQLSVYLLPKRSTIRFSMPYRLIEDILHIPLLFTLLTLQTGTDITHVLCSVGESDYLPPGMLGGWLERWYTARIVGLQIQEMRRKMRRWWIVVVHVWSCWKTLLCVCFHTVIVLSIFCCLFLSFCWYF